MTYQTFVGLSRRWARFPRPAYDLPWSRSFQTSKQRPDDESLGTRDRRWRWRIGMVILCLQLAFPGHRCQTTYRSRCSRSEESDVVLYGDDSQVERRCLGSRYNVFGDLRPIEAVCCNDAGTMGAAVLLSASRGPLQQRLQQTTGRRDWDRLGSRGRACRGSADLRPRLRLRE